ncbi:hypothetical protein Glove_43g62 [Diversispora epigaea]|uniref:Uncharacterized protein n=1 Tax=Diversispora epigaea TaxID=1348612 RepID=A0A397JI17_9GLOM|nr:hypothetical protein Glove_43g62 [Diversispora epigaea]
MDNFDTLLANVNIKNIHPPPEIEEIFRYKRIGKFNAILIRQVADHLWNTSTSQEKAEYFNLAQRVKSHY